MQDATPILACRAGAPRPGRREDCRRAPGPRPAPPSPAGAQSAAPGSGARGSASGNRPSRRRRSARGPRPAAPDRRNMGLPIRHSSSRTWESFVIDGTLVILGDRLQYWGRPLEAGRPPTSGGQPASNQVTRGVDVRPDIKGCLTGRIGPAIAVVWTAVMLVLVSSVGTAMVAARVGTTVVVVKTVTGTLDQAVRSLALSDTVHRNEIIETAASRAPRRSFFWTRPSSPWGPSPD